VNDLPIGRTSDRLIDHAEIENANQGFARREVKRSRMERMNTSRNSDVSSIRRSSGAMQNARKKPRLLLAEGTLQDGEAAPRELREGRFREVPVTRHFRNMQDDPDKIGEQEQVRLSMREHSQNTRAEVGLAV
jgi:hypothetical protein